MKAPHWITVSLFTVLTFAPLTSQSTQAAWSANPSQNTPVCHYIYDSSDDPQMVGDGAGGMIMVWRDTVDGDSGIYAQRLDASGNALWATYGESVCSWTGYQLAPMIVQDGSGGAVIAWQDYRNGSSEIYAQRVDGNGNLLWAIESVPICTVDGSGAPWQPILAPDGDGGAIIAWMDSRSGDWDIYAQRVDGEGTAQWGDQGIAVCAATDGQSEPAIVPDGAGGAVIAWADYRSGSHYEVYLQRVDGSGSMLWTANGVSTGSMATNAYSPGLLTDGASGAWVAWPDDSSLQYDIHVQRFDAAGTPHLTGGGEPACMASGDQNHPRLVSDDNDGIIVVWEDSRSGTDIDLYAQRLDASGTALWATDGIAVFSGTGDQYGHRLIRDGSGGTVITWVDHQGGSDFDIFAQRLDAWGDPLWPADGVIVCMAELHQLDPVLISDGEGGAYIAWDDQRNGYSYNIYAQHVDWNGRLAGARWPHESYVNAPVCTFYDTQDEHQVVSDGAGGAIVVWEDSRYGASIDIYAQRLDASGSPMWEHNGVAICTAANDQRDIQVLSDGAGGAFIAWEDERSGTDDIYAQRLDASGTALWTADGLAVCTATDQQRGPQLASDHAGGVIIVWEDLRSTADIYAQRVDGSGTMMWTANGVFVENVSSVLATPVTVGDENGGAIIAWKSSGDIYAQRVDQTGTVAWFSAKAICTSSGSQSNICITSDGSGGAIIAWSDWRSGSLADIYAQRITIGGLVLWTVDGEAICTDDDSQSSPEIVSDGNGGAIIAWIDSRSPGYGIYAQHIIDLGTPHWTHDGVAVYLPTATSPDFLEMVSSDSGGAILAWREVVTFTTSNIRTQSIDSTGANLWAADGVSVCTAPPYQDRPVLTADGSGGAIIAWDDYRNDLSNSDIYAQRIDHHGYLGDASPAIKSIVDHPDDQGSVAIVSWERSCFDEYPLQTITHYSVWSRLPDDPDRAGWTYLDEVPAYYQEEYGFNAASYEDWTGGAPFPLTEYKVMAHTDDHWVFWESEVRRGCSVDNLAPGAPLTLLGLPDNVNVLLSWEASGYHDEDLAHYNVYRGTTPGFTPDENSLIGTTLDIEYTDPSPGSGTFYYVVAGEDLHGNVGDPSNEAAVPLSTSTVGAALTCLPASGALPFVSNFSVQLTNQYQGQIRRIAGRINVTVAGGGFFSNWRTGHTNIAPGGTFSTSWNQTIPATGALLGENLFRLVAMDITPAPYNQPPYPPAGDSATDTATITGMAP